MGGWARECRVVRHEDRVDVDAVVRIVIAGDDRDLQRIDELADVSKAIDLWKLLDDLRFVAIDLGDIEHRECTCKDAATNVIVTIICIVVGGRLCLLPENNRRSSFALAYLRADSQPLPIGSPEAVGIAMSLRSDPECEQVDAAVSIA